MKAPAKKPAARKPAAKTKPAVKKAAAKPAKAAAKPAKAAPPAKPKAAAKSAAPAKPKKTGKPGLLDLVLGQLDDAKAEAIVTIDLHGKGAIADNMVVASGRSTRHVGAIADQLVEKLKLAGQRNIRVEGMPQCDWVLVDAGDIVIHLFRPEVRSFYNLEKLWSEHAPNERIAI